MEQIKVLPRDLSTLVKKTLYIKFFVIILLNNFIWIISQSTAETPDILEQKKYRQGYMEIIIRSDLPTNFSSEAALAILNKENKLLTEKAIFIKRLTQPGDTDPEYFEYLVEVPEQVYTALLPWLDQILYLAPKNSLIKNNTNDKTDQSHEINI